MPQEIQVNEPLLELGHELGTKSWFPSGAYNCPYNRRLVKTCSVQIIESTLTWLDLTSSDREKLRRILDLFNEQGTIDELGLGSLRDMFSEALFPGVNTVQTRLRYALFVPWIYKSLESRGVGTNRSAGEAARKLEIGLIKFLESSDDSDGTIGVQARDSLVRLPSNIYWTALKRWEIFKGEWSQLRYHQNVGSRDFSADLPDDDPGSDQVSWSKWHARLPEAPNSFPRSASFKLTAKEASFIQGRLEDSCQGTLLGWLARNGRYQLDYEHLWESSAASEAGIEIRRLIEHARRFSLHVEGMPLLYNLLIAELRIERGATIEDVEDDAERAQAYRQEIIEWAELESKEDHYDVAGLRNFASLRQTNPSLLQLQFVEDWSTRIRQIGPHAVADDGKTRVLIRERELKLKKNRSRLANLERLRDWQGGVGIGRMGFRWNTARRLLRDLFEGLEA